NGALFQAVGLAHPRLRTALLARELLNKRGRTVEVRIGSPVAPEKLAAIPTAREQVDYLRCRTYLLGRRERRQAAKAKSLPIAGAIDTGVLAREIETLTPLDRSGDLSVYLATAIEIPNTLIEIARLREVTFRAAGEG